MRDNNRTPTDVCGEAIACEQALLFGQAKRASRERFAARSRVLARLVSLAQIGELARRVVNQLQRSSNMQISWLTQFSLVVSSRTSQSKRVYNVFYAYISTAGKVGKSSSETRS